MIFLLLIPTKTLYHVSFKTILLVDFHLSTTINHYLAMKSYVLNCRNQSFFSSVNFEFKLKATGLRKGRKLCVFLSFWSIWSQLQEKNVCNVVWIYEMMTDWTDDKQRDFVIPVSIYCQCFLLQILAPGLVCQFFNVECPDGQ